MYSESAVRSCMDRIRKETIDKMVEEEAKKRLEEETIVKILNEKDETMSNLTFILENYYDVRAIDYNNPDSKSDRILINLTDNMKFLMSLFPSKYKVIHYTKFSNNQVYTMDKFIRKDIQYKSRNSNVSFAFIDKIEAIIKSVCKERGINVSKS